MAFVSNFINVCILNTNVYIIHTNLFVSVKLNLCIFITPFKYLRNIPDKKEKLHALSNNSRKATKTNKSKATDINGLMLFHTSYMTFNVLFPYNVLHICLPSNIIVHTLLIVRIVRYISADT